MPFYISDYLGDTGHLSTVEHGAYILLIMHYWSHGGLPADEPTIARITRMTARQWSQSRDRLRSLFGDDWRHKRIDKELAKAIEKSQVNSANAKRRHSERSADAERTHTQLQPQSEEEKIIPASAGDDASRETSENIVVESPQAETGKYVFDGGIIKLRQKHFDEWTRAFVNLDLRSELTARDAWLGSDRASEKDRRNWFISTSKYLANRNLEARTKRQQGQQVNWKFGIPGVV
jgi:uncharacterized protein YdaU (DUF1376 family)